VEWIGKERSVPTSVVVTTLTDAETYTSEDLAELYHQRWLVELDIRATDPLENQGERFSDGFMLGHLSGDLPNLFRRGEIRSTLTQ
jgi:hypothetical protein